MTIREEHARPVALAELTEEQLNWVSGGNVSSNNPGQHLERGTGIGNDITGTGIGNDDADGTGRAKG